jgi:uncharacterized protein
MFVLLSPSKTQNFQKKLNLKHTQPFFVGEIQVLIKELRNYTVKDLEELMGISYKLAELNFKRFNEFESNFNLENAKQAISAFSGDVYDGIEIDEYTSEDVDFAQEHIGIISGLYGLLRPLDLIQPYRLEMGVDLKVAGKKNLYGFWDDKITRRINSLNEARRPVVNLASVEYFKVINRKEIASRFVNIVFQEHDKGVYKIVGILAKRARGLMANYIVKNRVSSLDDLKEFKLDGYSFIKDRSDESNFVFVR